MIRVRELIEKLLEYNQESIVSICDLSYDYNREFPSTLLLEKIEIHRVCDMPAVLLSGSEED